MTTYKPKRSPFYHYDFTFKGVRHYGSTGCETKRKADEYERRKRQEAALPDVRRPPIDLDTAAGLYQDHAETLPSWKRTGKYMLKELVAELGRKQLLSAITQRQLLVYFAKRRYGRSNATVNREINIARALWNRANAARFEVGEMPDWKKLALPVAKKPPRELSAEKEEGALMAAVAVDAYDCVTFALESGWRRAEVIGLRWQDLDLPHAIARTKVKGGDTEVRPLNASLVSIIANQPKVGPYVFTYVCRQSRAKRRKGQRYPMTATVLRQRFEEAREAAEVQGFRFHDLRHTAATRILRATQNLAVTKEALKHKNISTTLRYAHVLNDDVRSALDAAKSRTIPELPKSDRRKG